MKAVERTRAKLRTWAAICRGCMFWREESIVAVVQRCCVGYCGVVVSMEFVCVVARCSHALFWPEAATARCSCHVKLHFLFTNSTPQHSSTLYRSEIMSTAVRFLLHCLFGACLPDFCIRTTTLSKRGSKGFILHLLCAGRANVLFGITRHGSFNHVLLSFTSLRFVSHFYPLARASIIPSSSSPHH